MTMFFSSAYSPSVKDDFRYPYHGAKMCRKCSRGIWIFKNIHKNRKSPQCFQVQFSTSESMNLKKSPFAYVLAVTNCSTGNKDPKLFSVDTGKYESKETPKHNCWMMKAYIFSALTKSLKTSTKTLFFCSSEAILLQNSREEV